jgi:SAM-dependent methyltransferase
MPENHHSYSLVADDYDQLRPGYPAFFLERLAARAGLSDRQVVADVGAGTGKLSHGLRQLGLRVVAVEPLAEMRGRIPSGDGVRPVGGVAERLPFRDGSLGAVVVGQAWHWFDPVSAAAEAHRVLAPGGRFVVVSNTFDSSAPWAREINRLRKGHRGAVAPGPGGPFDDPAAGGWSPGGEVSGRHDHVLPRESLADLVLTTSAVADAPPAVRRELTERILTVGRAHGLLDEPEFAIPFLLRATWLIKAGPCAR